MNTKVFGGRYAKMNGQILKRLLIKASSTLACVLLVGCADMFQERVAMQKSGNGSSLYTMFNAAKEIEKLDAPNQIFVSSGEYSDKIIVSWQKVNNADSYVLERAVSPVDSNGNYAIPDDADYELLEHSKFIKDTSFTDTIIDNTLANPLDYSNEAYSYVYFYRVSAENLLKNYETSNPCPLTDPAESKYLEDNVQAASGLLLTPPSNVKASCGESETEITITWDKSPSSVSSYRIYRSTDSKGSGASQIATVYGNKNSYTVSVSAEEQGVHYYFMVVAVGSSGNESVKSSVAEGYALKGGAPAQVTEVKVTKGRGDTKTEIELEWKEVSGASYIVYRYSSADATLKQLKEKNKTQASYKDDAGLKPNLYYYYRIIAYKEVNGEKVEGPMSEDNGTDNKGYLLSPPQNVKVDNQNRIFFSPAIGSDENTYTYTVSYCDTATGTFDSVTNTPQAPKNNPDDKEEIYTLYLDNIGDHKFYKIQTVNGISSDYSSVVAPAPLKAENCKVSRNGSIPGYTDVSTGSGVKYDEPKANSNGVHAVKITWQAPSGGADGGYHIYRSTKPDSGFKKITESPVTDLFYIYKDEQAKPGNVYYFRVLSLNSLGQGTNYSNVYGGYGALTTYQYVRQYIQSTLNSQKKLTLMHKSAATDKLGSDSCQGDISGSLTYNASMQGLGGRVIMHYTDYADYYIMKDKNFTIDPPIGDGTPRYFILNGNTNTTANISSNGDMDGTVTVDGMYPGSVVYDGIQIKGGAAGGGTYGVTRNLVKDDGSIEKITVQADWTWGEK